MKIIVASLVLLILMMIVPAYTWLSPHPALLTFKPYSSAREALRGLLNGDINLLPIDSMTVEIVNQLNNSGIRLIPISNFGFTYIGMNLRNPPLNDTKLRKAMLYGFNREKLLTDILGGFGETLNAGLFASAYATLGWKNGTADSYDYNPKLAMRLLDSAGYLLSSGQFRIDPSTGQSLRTMFILSPLDDAADVAAANSFALDMQAIGLPIINLPLSNLDFNFQVKRTYLFDIFIDTVSADSGPSWLYDLFAGGNDIAPVPLGSNIVGYRSADFDSCVKQLMSTLNQTTAIRKSLECQGILSDDLPALPVYSKYSVIATSLDPSKIVSVIGSLLETVKRTAVNIESTSNSEPVRIGIIGRYGNLDPTSTPSEADWTILNLVVEPLVTLNPDGSPAPGLAERWMQTAGDKITFILRDGLTFNNGEPIGVEDFMSTFKWLIANVKESSPLNSALDQIQNVTDLDARTLEITLRHPNRFALNALSHLFALPEDRFHLAANSSGPFNFLRSQALVASGPFAIVAFDQGNGVNLQMNNSYFNSAQTPESSENIIYASRIVNAFNGMNTGESQVGIGASTITYERRPISNATYTVYVYGENGTLVMNLAGNYLGYGIYSAILDAENPAINVGRYRAEGQIFGILPTGMFIIFTYETILIHSGLPITVPTIVVALAAASIVVTGREAASARKLRIKRAGSRKSRY